MITTMTTNASSSNSNPNQPLPLLLILVMQMMMMSFLYHSIFLLYFFFLPSLSLYLHHLSSPLCLSCLPSRQNSSQLFISIRSLLLHEVLFTMVSLSLVVDMTSLFSSPFCSFPVSTVISLCSFSHNFPSFFLDNSNLYIFCSLPSQSLSLSLFSSLLLSDLFPLNPERCCNSTNCSSFLSHP